MNDNDVKKIVRLRKHLINEYQKLNNPNEAPNAIMSERSVATILETTIRSLDDLIKDKVNFS
tara:strand:- start:30911 stop:31096 length:186 start_codon:yes stop_codon:yes gene_type:complete